MAWLAVVLAAARESFQAKDLGIETSQVTGPFFFFVLSICVCLVVLQART